MKKLLFLLFALIITINAVAQSDTIKQDYKKNCLKFDMVLLGFKNIHMGYEYRVSEHSAFGILPSYCIRDYSKISHRQEESFSVKLNYKYIIGRIEKKRSSIEPYFNLSFQYKYFKFIGKSVALNTGASEFDLIYGPKVYSSGSAYTFGITSGINILLGNSFSVNPYFGIGYNFDEDPIVYYDYFFKDPTYNGFILEFGLELGFVF